MSNRPLSIFGFLVAFTSLIVACSEAPAPDYSDAGRQVDAPSSEQRPAPPPSDATLDAALEPILDVLREPDAFTRAHRLSALLPTLDGAAAGQVRSLHLDVQRNLGAVESALLVRFWSRHDAEAAAHWALFESSKARQAAAIEIALTRWAQQDPQAAVAEMVAFTRSRGPFNDLAEIALVKGWFDSSKPGIPDYIQKLGVGFPRQRALAAFTRRWAQRDGVEPVMAWAESVPDDEPAYKKAVLRQTGSMVAMLDPVTTAAWCDRLCDDDLGSNLRAMVAQRWAGLDGPAAMEWVSRAPAGQERVWAVNSAFRGWWQYDSEGFRRWMDARGSERIEPWLQPVLGLYSGNLAIKEPREGIEWAARIEDDLKRERAFVTVAIFWRHNDEAAAEAWLDESPLSEEARDRVRNPGKHRITGPPVTEPTAVPEKG